MVRTLLWLCEAFAGMLSPVLVTSSGNLNRRGKRVVETKAGGKYELP